METTYPGRRLNAEGDEALASSNCSCLPFQVAGVLARCILLAVQQVQLSGQLVVINSRAEAQAA